MPLSRGWGRRHHTARSSAGTGGAGAAIVPGGKPLVVPLIASSATDLPSTVSLLAVPVIRFTAVHGVWLEPVSPQVLAAIGHDRLPSTTSTLLPPPFSRGRTGTRTA